MFNDLKRFSADGTLVSGSISINETSDSGAMSFITGTDEDTVVKNSMKELLENIFKTKNEDNKAEEVSESEEVQESNETDKEIISLSEFDEKVEKAMQEQNVSKEKAIEIVEEKYYCPEREFSF